MRKSEALDLLPVLLISGNPFLGTALEDVDTKERLFIKTYKQIFLPHETISFPHAAVCPKYALLYPLLKGLGWMDFFSMKKKNTLLRSLVTKYFHIKNNMTFKFNILFAFPAAKIIIRV